MRRTEDFGELQANTEDRESQEIVLDYSGTRKHSLTASHWTQ